MKLKNFNVMQPLQEHAINVISKTSIQTHAHLTTKPTTLYSLGDKLSLKQSALSVKLSQECRTTALRIPESI